MSEILRPSVKETTMTTYMKIRPVLSLVIIGACVGLGVMAGMIIAPVSAQSTYAKIGYVDVQAVLHSHPQFDSVMTQIQQFEQAKVAEISDYGNVDSLTSEQRQQLMDDIDRIQAEVDAERQRLTEPLIQDVIDATDSVGEESGPEGLEVILEKGSVMWGGLDLTPRIVQRIKGQ